MKNLIKIAGIDPSLRATGYGILNYDLSENEIWVTNCGVTKTPKRFKGIDAILYAIDQMREISKRDCFFDCDRIVVEFPAVFFSPKFFGGSLTPIAGISGACMVLFQDEQNPRIVPAYPSMWNGAKKKATTSALISGILGDAKEWGYDETIKVASEYEHVIDAVGMAYWLMERDYFERLPES